MGLEPDVNPGSVKAPDCGIANIAVYNGVIGSFLYGFMLCALNSCGDIIPVRFEWCENNWQSDCLASRVNSGLINAILYLGAAAGALLAGRPFIVERGSRYQLILSDIFFALGGFIGMFALGFPQLLASRVLSGIGLGISAIAAPLYIAEVSPREHRGFHSAKHGLFIAVGLLAAELIGLPQDPAPQGPGEELEGLNVWYWRLILGFPMVPALLQAALLQWALPLDPPSFLVNQGKVKEARDLLFRLYGLVPEGVCSLENEVVAQLELQIKDLAVASSEAKAIPRIAIVQAICDPFLRCSLWVGFFLAAFQQLCGINALMAYSNGLFQQAGTPPSYLTLASVGMCLANVAVSLMSTKLVDGWGRRTLILWGTSVQTVSMIAMVYLVQYVPGPWKGVFSVTCFSLFVVSFAAGLGAITWLWLSEIYPMEIRGPALSACGVVKWLSCFSVVLGARFLDLHSSCVLFGAVSGVGLIGTWLWVVETKGCSMDDSPMTPRSNRSSSTLMTPKDAVPDPETDYHILSDDSDTEFDPKAKLKATLK